jgi:hypothetical protein
MMTSAMSFSMIVLLLYDLLNELRETV